MNGKGSISTPPQRRPGQHTLVVVGPALHPLHEAVQHLLAVQPVVQRIRLVNDQHLAAAQLQDGRRLGLGLAHGIPDEVAAATAAPGTRPACTAMLPMPFCAELFGGL